jgi:peptidoglycan/LPS O-acetylase OafA/YrhL
VSHQILSQNFNYAGFYARRVKRILPAVYLLLTLVLLIYWLVFPSMIGNVGESALASIFSVSNVYQSFAKHGYFDVETMLRPLVHLWSLGVEEQFYLLWPMVLRFLGARHLGFLSLVIVAAFVLAEGLLRAQYAMVAYYWLFPRMGELGLGSLGYLLFSRYPKELARYAEPISAIGTALIGVSMVFFDELMPFPGLASLVPTLGAMMVLMAPSSFINSRLLTNRELGMVGLMSYSLYLYHWPLMAALRAMGFSLTAGLHLPGVLLLLLVCTYASYRYIETPFRRVRWSNRRIFITLFVVPLILVGALSIIAMTAGPAMAKENGAQGNTNVKSLSKGSPLQADALKWQSQVRSGGCMHDWYRTELFVEEKCRVRISNMKVEKKADIFIIADSTISMWTTAVYTFARLLKRDAVVANSGRGGCPVSGFHNWWGCPDCDPPVGGRSDVCEMSKVMCRKWTKALTSPKFLKEFRVVLIAGRWMQYLSKRQRARQTKLLWQKWSEIQKIMAAKSDGIMVILGHPPLADTESRSCPNSIDATSDVTGCATRSWRATARQIETNSLAQRFAAQHANTWYFDLNDVACPLGKCSLYTTDGTKLYSDLAHFTNTGAHQLAEQYVTAYGVPEVWRNVFKQDTP